MNSSTCSIFFHNYYGRHAEWIQFFAEKIKVPFNLFYNIVGDSIYNLQDVDGIPKPIPGTSLQKLIIRRSTNQGKDIGGKLVLLDTWLQSTLQDEFIVFLHDKMSPHKIQNVEWKNKLFRIIEPDFIADALHVFHDNDKTGVVAGLENINNELDHTTESFTSTNQAQLSNLLSTYPIKVSSYSYVAGTMFWARSAPLKNFFQKYPPLDIRKTLERGNIMDERNGSTTHAWERFLCWLIIAQGFSIKGL